jgi:type VI secretion system secreted protein VgrG
MSFAPIGNAGGGGAPSAGGLSGLGQVAGMAGQLGALAGMPGAGLLNGAASAVQLAQTGMALMGKTPESIAGAINSLTGDRPKFTQRNRYATIDSPLGPDVLLINALIVDEHVNQLTEIHIDALSHQNNIEPQQIVGQRVSITLDPNTRNYSLERIVAVSREIDNRRYFDGYVASFGRVGSSGNVTRYEMSVAPWFWFLTRSTDCRIFQHETPESILATIFHEQGFSDFEFEVRNKRPEIKYMVMYCESYYNFCARLMEQEGLIWTFRYVKGKHILVISDSNAIFRELPTLGELEYHADSAASERDGIERWDEAFSFRVGKVAFRDFNAERPWSKLMLVEARAQTLKHPNIGDTERYEHQSLYDDFDNGQRYVRYAMEAEEAQARCFTGVGYASGMTTTGRFKLINHRSSTYNSKGFGILHVRHEAVNDFTQQVARLPYRNTFTCLPIEIPFRPERRTPKPSMQGTQTAIVVGPPGEEIYTDGSCVKVHFHWDRRGKMDGTDSMWIRVSQPWAGKGWGGSAIPRIGQEVVIAHDQGDPDMPLVIGRVFNGEAANPYHGSAGQTMGIKSQTHKGKGSNELRFSDVNGAQEVFLHAQKDMNTVVEDSETHHVVGGSRTVVVSSGDETKQIGKGSLNEAIAQARTTTATTVAVTTAAKDGGGGTQEYEAERGIMLKVKDSFIMLAPEGIQLQHKGSVILMDDSGITVNGQRIDLNK